MDEKGSYFTHIESRMTRSHVFNALRLWTIYPYRCKAHVPLSNSANVVSFGVEILGSGIDLISLHILLLFVFLNSAEITCFHRRTSRGDWCCSL